MPIVKRVLFPQRLRRVPPQFSWVDQRLVRDEYICRCTHQELALYLFLCTVADAQGLSYYSDGSMCRFLRLDAMALAHTRGMLIERQMVAYQKPLYQVLSLEKPRPPCPEPMPLSDILGQIGRLSPASPEGRGV